MWNRSILALAVNIQVLNIRSLQREIQDDIFRLNVIFCIMKVYSCKKSVLTQDDTLH